MSQTSVKEMFQKAEQDATLRDELEKVLTDPEKGAEAVLELAGRYGFKFSTEDFVAVARSIAEIPEGELSDEALTQVAGGYTMQAKELSLLAMDRIEPPAGPAGVAEPFL